MKKLCVFLISVVCVLLFISCNFNEPLRNKMIDYYSKNTNYVVLSGEIVEFNQNYVKIKCEELNNYISYEDEICDYYIYSKQLIELSIGAQITFTTGPFHFYNGHKLPIVELKLDGNTLLSFEEGKENLIDWVNVNFK